MQIDTIMGSISFLPYWHNALGSDLPNVGEDLNSSELLITALPVGEKINIITSEKQHDHQLYIEDVPVPRGLQTTVHGPISSNLLPFFHFFTFEMRCLFRS
jgi:hypothetical protein